MREPGLEETTRRDWLRLAEAAALLGVSPSTLRRWGDTGKVACRRTPGGQRRFARPEILRWLADRRSPPLAAPSSRLGDDSLSRSSPSDSADLRTLVDASLEFGRSLDLDEVIVSIARRLRAVADAATCDICAWEEGGTRGLVSVDGDVVHESFAGRLYPASEFFLTARQHLRQEPIEVFDIETQRGASEAECEAWLKDGYRSGLRLPLVADGEQIGEVLLLDHVPRRFPHLELLQGLAQLAARTIANAALHRDLAAHDRRAVLINESGLAFVSSIKPEDVFLATAQRLCAAIDVPYCDIYSLTGPDELTCAVSLGDDEIDLAWQGRDLALHEWATWALAVETRTTVAVASDRDERLNELERREMRGYGQRSCLTVPLIARDAVIGLVELLETRAERTFTDDEIATVESVCRMAALAIDNAGVYREQEEHARRLTSLIEASRAITSSVMLDDVLDTVARETVAALATTDCTIWVYDEATDTLTAQAFYEVQPSGWEWAGATYALSDYAFGREILERDEVCLECLSDEGLDPASRISMEANGEKSCLSIPLSFGGRPMGLVVMTESTYERHFSANELELARALGEQASVAIHNAHLFREIRRLHLANLMALSSALSAKDYYTLGHAARVAAYMVLMGRELGWPEDRIAEAQDAAYLHDIGKIGVSDRVLLKPGPLNAEEWELMRQHPAIGAEIVRPLFAEDLVAGVRHHHERFAGGGYPDGLVGKAIPPIARAMCVVDCYDAMSCARPYRRGMTYPECLDELRKCSGTQFDPEMVEVFLRVLASLDERRRRIIGVAVEAARLVDPEAHALLRTRADEARPQYREMVAALRRFRDGHPGVRFITTYATEGDTCITVLDTGETAAEVSHVGDRWFDHDELAAVLAGASLEANVFSADGYGVWLSRCVPIRDARGTVVGALTVDEAAVEANGRQELRGDFSQGLASMLQTATLRYSRAELEAITDGLTGLYNHRYLHERLDEELTRARDEGRSLSVLFVDLDQFKSFNDTLGHKTGDDALCRVARAIESSTRRIDMAARYGGDEFVVVLLGSDAQAATTVAERIRQTIADDTTSDDVVTVSIGTATFPADAGTKAELLDRADWAMYEAKRAGRDRVVAFSGETVSSPTAAGSTLKGAD